MKHNLKSQLKKGITVEAQEHADISKGNSLIAARIALAHLKEDPQYYTHLAMMEKRINGNEANKKAVERLAQRMGFVHGDRARRAQELEIEIEPVDNEKD